MLEVLVPLVDATLWAVPRPPKGPWWEFALLLVGLTKMAVFGIPIFCAYQAFKVYEAGDTDSGEFWLWFLGAGATAGGCIGWATS